MGDLYINSGTEVSVDPGVVVKVWNNSSIFVEGGFKADGNSDERIVFTSIKDDNFGNPFDTNGDGNATAPEVNNWKTINFKSTSDDTFSLLNNCRIKFSGYNSTGGVTYTDAAANISNTIISDSYYGIRCEGSSTPNVDWVSIQNCDADPIAMSLKSNPTFTNITFAANGSSGIKILEGTLASDATLAKRDVAGINNIAYIIDDLIIGPTAKLTINPGVVIKYNFGNYRIYSINVQGALIANGTASERIVFTSIADDSKGGDTNNDGNTSVPDRGDWRSIQFNSSTLANENSLTNCDIRYGGNTLWLYDYNWGSVRIFSAYVGINNCVIEQSESVGVGVFGSATPSISNTQINNITHTPIAMSMFANPTFSNNNALNIGIIALGIVPENYSLDATVPKRNFAGYNNITYYLFGTSTINSGTKITIQEGTIFKSGRLNVNGALTIAGSSANPVVFTDVKDDDYGNPMDTNDDGTASTPSVTSTRIQFYDVSDDANSIIDNTILRYSDVAIHLDQASPTLTNLTFNNNNWGVYLTGVSNPALNNCIFDDLKYAPFRTSLVSYPSSTSGNIISGSTYKAIGVLDNETLVQDVALPKRNFAGINNIPYLFGNYTVASNATLTVSPGVILKFFPYTKLTVRKGLQAIGGSTPDSTIVFTDIRDDFYGGDSNSDSTETTPWSSSPGWHGIYFEDESLDPLCVIDHSVIQYVGHYYYTDRGAIVATNASPTISNSTFKNNYHTLVAKGASNPTINYCDIYQNTGMGINNVDKSFVINAENNWWGDDSGPTHSSNPGGIGSIVTDAVDFDPWLGAGASNPILGDVSLNGNVQAFDASKVLKHVVGSELLNTLQLSVADVSGATGVTTYDASLILQYSVGLISSFPAEVGDAPASPMLDKKTRSYLALQKVDNVNLSVKGTSVNFGEGFTIPIDISNTKGVTAVQIEIDVNSKLYSVSDVTLADEFSEYNMSFYFNENTEKLIVAIAGSRPMEAEGNLLNLDLVTNEELKGKVTEEIKVSKFLANENNLTKSVLSESVQFIGKPTQYSLEQNYPNPFNPSTIISYQIPDDNVDIKLVIYNIQGEVVNTLVNKSQNAGNYQVMWNATNNYGGKVSTGVYIYRITAGKFTSTKKLMVLK
jgi:parallel beta-helix repeat protein